MAGLIMGHDAREDRARIPYAEMSRGIQPRDLP